MPPPPPLVPLEKTLILRAQFSLLAAPPQSRSVPADGKLALAYELLRPSDGVDALPDTLPVGQAPVVWLQLLHGKTIVCILKVKTMATVAELS